MEVDIMGCNPIKAATDFVGLTDYKGEERAAAQSAQAQADSKALSQESLNLTKEEIEFQREQYADWKEIYGDLQEDIGTYFKNISGDTITSQQLTAIQRESQLAQTQVDQALAQRGLTGSGLEAQALQQNMFGTAQQKATVRANADQMVAEQQMGFLGLGLGQGTNMLGINAQVSSAGASNAASMSNTALGSSVGFGNTSQNYSAANMGTMNTLAFGK